MIPVVPPEAADGLRREEMGGETGDEQGNADPRADTDGICGNSVSRCVGHLSSSGVVSGETRYGAGVPCRPWLPASTMVIVVSSPAGTLLRKPAVPSTIINPFSSH